MKDNRHLLKLLLPGSANWADTGGKSFGGITKEDVAGALASLSDEASLFCRVKYLDQPELRHRLYGKVLVNESFEFAMKYNWKAGHLDGLTTTALDEALESRMLCRKCGGKGFIQVDQQAPQECKPCRSSGWVGYSKAYIARQCGIDKSNFDRIWLERYTLILGVFLAYEDEIIRALSKI